MIISVAPASSEGLGKFAKHGGCSKHPAFAEVLAHSYLQIGKLKYGGSPAPASASRSQKPRKSKGTKLLDAEPCRAAAYG